MQGRAISKGRVFIHFVFFFFETFDYIRYCVLIKIISHDARSLITFLLLQLDLISPCYKRRSENNGNKLERGS